MKNAIRKGMNHLTIDIVFFIALIHILYKTKAPKSAFFMSSITSRVIYFLAIHVISDI